MPQDTQGTEDTYVAPHVTANVERFSGFAEIYDQHRPRPPAAIADLLVQLALEPRPRVVDIGSGTGLSTLLWAGRGAEIVGVEPSSDMRQQAQRRADAVNANDLRFQDGLSTRTGIQDRWADVVTCSQSLHWMEPAGTFAEVARILRDDGVFAAYDCDWPPALNWKAERAFLACMERAEQVEAQRRLSTEVRRWNKGGHLERMRNSGHFRYVREVVFHHLEEGDAQRLVGVALSQGAIETLLKHGISEDEAGVTALRVAAREALGDAKVPWYWSYRMRIGVK